MTYQIDPVGFIQSPYKEKFAVPRQPRLAPSATSRLKLVGEANSPEAVRGIEQFSHLWLLFLFDQNLGRGSRIFMINIGSQLGSSVSIFDHSLLKSK